MSREQEADAAAEEISARQAAVGGSWAHHGNALVPRQSCFGQDTRALMNGLAVPVMHQFGRRPATVTGTKNQIAPLTINKDLDKLGVLKGVTTFNVHLHLPYDALTTKDSTSIHMLARQPIDLSRPHPFTAAGNQEFKACLGMPPKGKGGGPTLLADSTGFTTWFGGTARVQHC